MDNFNMQSIQCNGRKFIGQFVENLRILWDKGIDVFNKYNNQNFKMDAIKGGRRITWLRDMILHCTGDMLIIVEFDHLDNPLGEVGMKFKSFVVTQTRNHVRIVYMNLDHLTFDIPKTKLNKRR
ncbi:hypothetical protein CR513_45004, partial [Mucuna pruriens]